MFWPPAQARSLLNIRRVSFEGTSYGLSWSFWEEDPAWIWYVFRHKRTIAILTYNSSNQVLSTKHMLQSYAVNFFLALITYTKRGKFTEI